MSTKQKPKIKEHRTKRVKSVRYGSKSSLDQSKIQSQKATPPFHQDDIVQMQKQHGNSYVNDYLAQHPNVMRETVTFSDNEVDVIKGDPHAKTWEGYIQDYNYMIDTILRNLQNAWQDGVNTFETQMQFPGEGEAQPKIGEALLNAATKELFSFLVDAISAEYPGVGKAIGAVKELATAVYDEQKRAKEAAQSMSLGNFIVQMRTGLGNCLNDLANQTISRKDSIRADFIAHHLNKDTEFEQIQFIKRAITQLVSLKVHSQPITRALAETWIAENFKQESNWLGQIMTTGVIELKYEVYKQNGSRNYNFQHCQVKMAQGGRVAKAINATYASQQIDLKAFRCRKNIILENRDNKYQSEEGILDNDNQEIAGFLGAFGWYQQLPKGLIVEKIDEI